MENNVIYDKLEDVQQDVQYNGGGHKLHIG